MRLYGDIEERVLHKGLFTDFCWEWQGCKNNAGYGRVRLNGKTCYVHRAIIEWIYKRRLKSSEFVDHLCRNRLCFRPSHLEIVTCRENVRRGSVAKLKSQDIYIISWMANENIPHTVIAKKFGIHQSHVSKILSGKRWKNDIKRYLRYDQHHHRACDKTFDMFKEEKCLAG